MAELAVAVLEFTSKAQAAKEASDKTTRDILGATGVIEGSPAWDELYKTIFTKTFKAVFDKLDEAMEAGEDEETEEAEEAPAERESLK
jgi:hypothetical protein